MSCYSTLSAFAMVFAIVDFKLVFKCNAEISINPSDDYKFACIYDSDNSIYDYATASSYCASTFGTTLASIHSESDQENIINCRENSNQFVRLGLNDVNDEGTFVWSDGTDYDYDLDWAGAQYTGNNDDKDCLILGASGNGNIYPCENGYKQFACNLLQVPPILTKASLDGKYICVYNSEDSIYDYETASGYCQANFGTTLASIHSSDDQENIVNCRLNTNQFIRVGLNDIDNEGTYVWSDGSNYDYDLSPVSNLADRDCLILGLSGIGNMYPCENKYKQFACNNVA